MIKFLKLSAVVLGTSMVIGCTNNALQENVDRLNADVSALKAQSARTSDKADQAARDASAAAVNAAAATSAANRAANSAAETNQKLDRMLNKAMMK